MSPTIFCLLLARTFPCRISQSEEGGASSLKKAVQPAFLCVRCGSAVSLFHALSRRGVGLSRSRWMPSSIRSVHSQMVVTQFKRDDALTDLHS